MPAACLRTLWFMQRSAKFALVAVVAVTVVGSFAFWFFVLRSSAPERAALPEPAPVTTEAPAANGDDSGSPDGTWVVGPGDGFVGYRIDELFGGETIKVTAVGRTPTNEGSLTIEGTTITEADIVADFDDLTSDSGQRDNYIRTRALQTAEFPEARFVLTAPVELGALPELGEAVTVVATGDLTLRDVTRSVDVELEARWDGETIEVAGGAPIDLPDFDIEVISIPFVTIDDNGEFELQLTFRR